MDVAQRVLNAGRDGDVPVLGQTPGHAWLHRGNGWSPVDLVPPRQPDHPEEAVSP